MKKIALFVMLFAVGCFAVGCSPATEIGGSIPVGDIVTSTDDITEAGGEDDTDASSDDTDATGDDTDATGDDTDATGDDTDATGDDTEGDAS